MEIFTVLLQFHRDFLITVLHSLWSIENSEFSFLLGLLDNQVHREGFLKVLFARFDTATHRGVYDFFNYNHIGLNCNRIM